MAQLAGATEVRPTTERIAPEERLGHRKESQTADAPQEMRATAV